MSVRKPKRSVLLALAVFCLLPMAAEVASAQDWKGRGRISGTVKTADGEPIKDANVHIYYKGNEGEGPNVLTTNKRGKWSYMGLTSGAYTVVVEAAGYVGVESQIRVNEYSPPPPPLDVKMRTTDSRPSEEGDRLMALVTKGNELMVAKQYPEARAAFEEVLTAIEDDAQKRPLLVAVAGTYLEEGQTALARERFLGLIETSEDPAEKVGLLQNVARSYYVEKNVDQSVATLEQALALAPDDPDSTRLIVDILLAAGREKDAEPYMARLPEGEKIDPNALLNLGIGAYNDGDMDTALEKFNKVLAAYPDNADAHYYLGLVHMGKMKNDLALASFGKMLELQPDHANAAEARQFMDYLKTQ